MTLTRLILRNLAFYWRSHLAVLFGVSAAVSVLAGALVVGDSVRGSLRMLFLDRLGRTDDLILSAHFFREELSQEIQRHPSFATHFQSAAPLVSLEGVVTAQTSGRRASRVQVYGVDERFWTFHEQETREISDREVLVNSTLSTELDSGSGEAILVTVENPSGIPLESLHGQRHEVAQTMRYTVREILPASGVGEFSTQPTQASVRVVFVPLRQLQHDLDVEGRANVLLLSRRSRVGEGPSPGDDALRQMLRDSATVEDVGLWLRPVEACNCLTVESESTLISDAVARSSLGAADRLNLKALPILTYLANEIRSGAAAVPYSLVSAVDFPNWRKEAGSDLPPIWLNEWAARRLPAGAGDEIELEYYVWEQAGELATRRNRFRLTGTVPIATADADFAPQYPGITDAEDFSSWDPPFPIDLSRIDEDDEDYWDRYRTTPKAFIPLEVGRELWGSRFGALTSVRIFRSPGSPEGEEATWDAYARELREILDPLEMGFSIVPVRAAGLQASEGATDFGEYFLYFSFFLMMSALLLTGLFFRLGVEQRLREIGLLRAVGFPPSRLGSVFFGEGLVLALAGSLLGVLGAWVYSALIMLGLRTWWIGAVGTTELRLHANAASLTLGAVAGVVIALVSIAWSLRKLLGSPARQLLAGLLEESASRGISPRERGRRRKVIAVVSTVAGFALVSTAFLGLISESAGFFGAGLFILIGLLIFQSEWIKSGKRTVHGNGIPAVWRLGMRNASHRPGRSILCIGFIATAAFIIVAVEAFRHDGSINPSHRRSGTGGFTLLATSVLPIPNDPNSLEGREALNLPSELGEIDFYPMRVRPGEDVSCLNLYRPQNPSIMGVPEELAQEERFRFQDSLAETPRELENPWRLLERDLGDVVPVIADATSMRYVLHRGLGDEIVLQLPDGNSLRLRLVAALADSLFQGELLMSEKYFLRFFPQQQGYRFFLIDAPTEAAQRVSDNLEEYLSDFGFDVVPTAERLADFHRVENTYLSTFQLLGGLGLVLGTVGLATVLLRNVIERRRELALLRALGYRDSHFSILVIAENSLLLSSGLLIGVISALLAVAPALLARGDFLPGLPLNLLIAVVLAGALASILAAAAASRTPLLNTLKEEL